MNLRQIQNSVFTSFFFFFNRFHLEPHLEIFILTLNFWGILDGRLRWCNLHSVIYLVLGVIGWWFGWLIQPIIWQCRIGIVGSSTIRIHHDGWSMIIDKIAVNFSQSWYLIDTIYLLSAQLSEFPWNFSQNWPKLEKLIEKSFLVEALILWVVCHNEYQYAW